MKARVAIVAHTARWSGAPACTARLLERVDRSRFDPIVFCPYPGSFVDRLEAVGVPVELAFDVAEYDKLERTGSGLARALRFGPAYVRRLDRFLRRVAPDLVYVPSLGNALPAALARRHDLPLCVHVHESWSFVRSVGARLRRAPLLRGSHPMIAVSRAVASMLENVGVARERLAVVHNGVDAARFAFDPTARESLRRAWGVPADVPIVASLGTMHAGKGAVEFVHIARAALERAGDLRFVWIGGALDGAYEATVRNEIERLGLGSHVRLLGARDDVAACLSAVDVLATPTREEAFSLAHLEAMAAGVPVVTHRVAGCDEAIVDGEHGLVVEPGDVDQFAAAVAQLATDRSRRRAMGDAARARVARDFTLDAFAQGVVDVWARTLEARSGVRAGAEGSR